MTEAYSQPEIMPRERQHMTDAERDAIMRKLDSNEPLVDAAAFNDLARSMASDEPLEPYDTIVALGNCSEHMAALLKADVGILRACALGEHTEADLSGVESYRELFAGDARAMQVLRLTSICRDLGKSLCVAKTGDNLRQSEFNVRITNNLLRTLTPDTLSDTGSEVEARAMKEMIRLGVGNDIIGGALQGRFDQRELDMLRRKWPSQFVHHFSDFLIVSYLSDASAHTGYRYYTDPATLELRPCTTDADAPYILDHLFVPMLDNKLTLTEPYAALLSHAFPDRRATRTLIADHEVEPLPLPNYELSAEAEGAWSTTFELPEARDPEAVKQLLQTFTAATGFPISAAFLRKGRYGVYSVTLARDPSQRYGTRSVIEHRRAAAAIALETGWRKIETLHEGRAHVTACVGLLEGYDKTAIKHPPVEALNFLLAHGRGVAWRTETVELTSVRSVQDSETGESKLEAYSEPVLRISGTAREGRRGDMPLTVLCSLAEALHQQRFFADDYTAYRTVALKAIS